MNKNAKKLLIASIPLVVGAMGSMSALCTPRFNQTYDGHIDISTGFSETNPQGKALKSIIDFYNAWLKKHPEKEKEGYLPARLTPAPNGYNTDDLTTKLKNKEKNTFYNAIINYPAAASLISKYKMNLGLSDADYEAIKYASSFKDVNKTIAGNTKNEKWVIPMSKSSEMAAVNKPVVGKLINQLVEWGAKIDDSNSTKIKEILKGYINGSTKTEDGKKVDEIWDKSKLEDAEVLNALKEQLKNYTISDDIFSSYTKLIDFAIWAKRAFPKKKDLPIVGFDSIMNAINALASSLTKGDLSQNFINKDDKFKKTGGYDFDSFINDKNSKQYKLFEQVTEILRRAIQYNAIWVGGSGAYGSSSLVPHKLGISIGSTAGYTHTFAKEGQGADYAYWKLAGVADEQNIDSARLLEKKNPSSDVLWQINDLRGHKNKIFNHTATLKSQYDLKAKDKASEDLLNSLDEKGALSSWDQLIEKDGKVYANLRDKSGNTKEVELPGAKKIGQVFKKLLKGQEVEDGTTWYYIPKEIINHVTKSAAEIANESDVAHYHAPYLAGKSNNETNSVFTQGPSFVPIHANTREDKATQLFLKWFTQYVLKNDEEIKSGKKIEKNDSIINIFNKLSGYISPTEEYMKKSIDDPVIKNLDYASQLAFQGFKKTINEADKYKIVDDVASPLSNVLRKAMESSFKSLVNKSPSSFDDLVKSIKQTFIE